MASKMVPKTYKKSMSNTNQKWKPKWGHLETCDYIEREARFLGFVRIRQDPLAFVRIRQDSSGFVRIR